MQANLQFWSHNQMFPENMNRCADLVSKSFIFIFLIYSSKTREDTLLLCYIVICYGLLKCCTVVCYRVKILNGHLLWRVKMLTAIARN